MTTAPATFTPHPLAPPLRAGDVVNTWCSAHMVRTRHLWNGHRLICIEPGCRPELDPEAQQPQEGPG
jgi:hypothetical protein